MGNMASSAFRESAASRDGVYEWSRQIPGTQYYAVIPSGREGHTFASPGMGPGVLFPPPRVMRGAQERREKPKNVRF